jgi:hypothetical protein
MELRQMKFCVNSNFMPKVMHFYHDALLGLHGNIWFPMYNDSLEQSVKDILKINGISDNVHSIELERSADELYTVSYEPLLKSS